MIAPIVFASLLAQSEATSQPVEYRDWVEYSWVTASEPTSKGFGFVAGRLTDRLPDWVEPNVPGLLGIGFDSLNPKTQDMFNADGNWYGRPEQEVSIHWNGREVANRLSPVAVRSEAGQRYRVRSESVVGGSEVSVWVGESAVFDRFFVPGMKPRLDAWMVGGYQVAEATGATTTFGSRPVNLEEPIKVSVFNQEVNNAQRHRFNQMVELPERLRGVGRVVATFRLGPTAAGIDRWDRLGQIFLVPEKGDRVELLRFITPYRKGWEWKVDVTDFLPLLTGKTSFEYVCETWGEGWSVDLDLEFSFGKRAWIPTNVQNLWSGVVVLGDPTNPTESQLPTLNLPRIGANERAELRWVVTGHGQSPNAENAAEFLPLWRRVMVGSQTFTNTLWKDDVYLNPCRPQGGTWKFSRAGWAPGDTVKPWEIDVTDLLRKGTQTLRYEIQPYTNTSPDPGNPARQVIEAQLIVYRKG
ncbi:MAG: hypothetical protein JNM85_02845 [Chthonomonas sp.]|nr:hypothetical protein [Chthonomonas sp.]